MGAVRNAMGRAALAAATAALLVACGDGKDAAKAPPPVRVDPNNTPLASQVTRG